MPGFFRGRRRKPKKLSDRQRYLNFLLLETCGRIKERNTQELKQCDHKLTIELEIPNNNCEDCVWEKMVTDNEYDPDDE